MQYKPECDLLVRSLSRMLLQHESGDTIQVPEHTRTGNHNILETIFQSLLDLRVLRLFQISSNFVPTFPGFQHAQCAKSEFVHGTRCEYYMPWDSCKCPRKWVSLLFGVIYIHFWAHETAHGHMEKWFPVYYRTRTQ